MVSTFPPISQPREVQLQEELQTCLVLKPRLFFLHLHSGLLKDEDPKDEDPKDEARLFPELSLDVPETLD